MRKPILALALLSSVSLAHAGPGLMFGVNFNMSSGFGVSVKVLTSDRENRTVGSLGTTYYPATKHLGVDIGVGRTFDNGAAIIGWDLINNAPQASVGYVNTRR
jgi:hypothetical protein